MKELMQFTGPLDVNLRTIVDERTKDIWFIAKDVAEALGYADPDQAVRKRCKKVMSVKELNDKLRVGENIYNEGVDSVVKTDIFHGNVKLIPESDFNRLVLGSKLPSAIVIQDWVCEELMPSVRKTGKYAPAEKEVLRLSHIEEVTNALIQSDKMSKRDFLVSVRKAVKSGASTKYLDPSVVEMLGTISTESLASKCRISPVQFKKQRVLFLAGLEDEDGNLTEEGKKWCEVDACPYTARRTVRWYPEAVERIKSYS